MEEKEKIQKIREKNEKKQMEKRYRIYIGKSFYKNLKYITLYDAVTTHTYFFLQTEEWAKEISEKFDIPIIREEKIKWEE